MILSFDICGVLSYTFMTEWSCGDGGIEFTEWFG